MENRKVVIAGGGVLGTQIGLICAYHGFDTTFWLRSEGSVGRTMPKIERYSALMLEDLANAKTLIGNPIGGMLYPRGLIRRGQEELCGKSPHRTGSEETPLRRLYRDRIHDGGTEGKDRHV